MLEAVSGIAYSYLIKIALWRGLESVSAVEDQLRQLFERSEFWRNPEQAYRLFAM